MDDTTLLDAFSDGTLPLSQWDHKAHIKVAFLRIRTMSLYPAIDQMRKDLQHYLRIQDIPTSPDVGYHETLTQAWMRLVFAMMGETPACETAEAFCEQHPQLLQKTILRLFYSRQHIMSADARQAFVEPDLAPLPAPRHPNQGCLSSSRKQMARAFAAQHHGDQMYGAHPYTYHLDVVADILAPYAEDAVIIGYLHDILEDTDCTRDDLDNTFGEPITTCVTYLTDPPLSNRKARKQHAHELLASIDEDGPYHLALLVKAADRLANMRECQTTGNHGLEAMYKREYPAFRNATYREGIAPHIWKELDNRAETHQPNTTGQKGKGAKKKR